MNPQFEHKHNRKTVFCLILSIVGLVFILWQVCTSCRGIPSAYFRLSDDSPLPSWVVLPAGVNRSQLSVTITVYEATTTPKWKLRFVVRDNSRLIFKTIQEETGYGYWHPDSLRKNPPGGSFPNWIIVEVKGTQEVYQQSKLNDLLKIVKKPLS
jgi:hypothetical protein